MDLNEDRAREILDRAHAAWANGDIEGVLSEYAQDLTYWCNTGGPDGGALCIEGKDAFRAYLRALASTIESITIVDYFRFRDGVARAGVEFYIRHKATGHKLAGVYRQVITYRDSKILRLEQYHDAARRVAFWSLVGGRPPDSPTDEASG